MIGQNIWQVPHKDIKQVDTNVLWEAIKTIQSAKTADLCQVQQHRHWQIV